MRRLQARQAILEAKVREALATQPAAIDPRELVKAQEKIQSLLKENELLKATPARARQITPAGHQGTGGNQARPRSQSQTGRANGAREFLAAEKESLRTLALTAETEGTNNPAGWRRFRTRTASWRNRLWRRASSRSEQEALQQRVSKLSASAEAADALRAENELLKQQLAQLKPAAPPASQVEESRRRTAEAEARLAALQSDAEVLRLEKSALESRLKTKAPAAGQGRRQSGGGPAAHQTTGGGARRGAAETGGREQGIAAAKFESRTDRPGGKIDAGNRRVAGAPGCV